MAGIKDHGSYQLTGKLVVQAEVIASAMNADKAPRAPLGREGDKKLYLIRRHASDHKENHIIGSVEFPEHGSFLIAKGI